ncbi:MAG: cytidylate kinase-like family protein [Deltaproteobacteria bacterium]|nr:cytidylate kinase-like family protein [Deltaproteobacteria bacterium]
MAIITISRGSFSKGRAVAEKVAQTLGYACISREVLLEVSEHFNINEIKLEHALHDAPSILERFTYGKESYLAYIAAAILEEVHHDNVIYHGLAGQFFLRGVSHVLKVRILADMDDRVALMMAREQLSKKQAIKQLRRDDHERRQWSKQLFGVDTWDSSLYDMVLHVHKLSVDDASNLISQAAQMEQFKATPESRKMLENLVIAARVRARLVHDYPMVQVHADDGVVTVDVKFNETVEPELTDEIKALVHEMPGVKDVRMHPISISAYAHDPDRE